MCLGKNIIVALIMFPGSVFPHATTVQITAHSFGHQAYTALMKMNLILTVDSPPSSNVPAALQSIFPQTELGAFMVLLKRDKEQQLIELSMIVTGIRLLNRASEKGEEETDIHELSTALWFTCFFNKKYKYIYTHINF